MTPWFLLLLLCLFHLFSTKGGWWQDCLPRPHNCSNAPCLLKSGLVLSPLSFSSSRLSCSTDPFLNIPTLSTTPQEKENSLEDGFQTSGITGSSCVSSLLAHPAEFGPASLYHCVSQFLKINLCLCIHALLVLFLWRTLTLSFLFVFCILG